MVEVVGVRFKKAGKVYYFNPSGEEIKKDGHVIVETARGIEYGTVVLGNTLVHERDIVAPLKPVIRKAGPEDDEIDRQNKKRETEAFEICLKKIAENNMDMKLIDVEITFDHNKLIFYFTSDGRVDFRDLVKDLASVFRTRIELRQIGVRDEAKMLNSVGICGRGLCCSSFLGDFHPVSIKMAKEQNLSLNPTKISGICGRLMCCLKYEESVYEELNKKMPGVGDMIKTPDGMGEVLATNVLMQTAKTAVKKLDTDATVVNCYSVKEISIVRRKKKKKNQEEYEIKADDYQ